MSAYIDTSALAKCYIREPRSLEVLGWVEARAGASICGLTMVEFRCLLARRRRNGDITPEIERAALAQWEIDIQSGTWHVEPLAAAEYETARSLIDRLPGLPLRALDAIHLAAAHNAACEDFLTADRIQASAAQLLGFTVHTFFESDLS